MKPEVLVLDEPTAGLDPRGRDEILDQIAMLHKDSGMTVILVTHSMEDVAKYVDRILVMRKGLAMDEETSKVFSRYKDLEKCIWQLTVTYVMNALKDRGFVNTDVNTVTEARDEILECFRNNCRRYEDTYKVIRKKI